MPEGTQLQSGTKPRILDGRVLCSSPRSTGMNQPLQRSVGGEPVCSQGLRPLCSAERETLGVRECTCISDESDGLLEFCDGAVLGFP